MRPSRSGLDRTTGHHVITQFALEPVPQLTPVTSWGILYGQLPKRKKLGPGLWTG